MEENRYFDASAYKAGRTTESQKRGSGNTFFSSKQKNKYGEETQDFFEKFAGQTLRIVGTKPMPKDEKSGVKAYNVVLFDDGHQLSTTALFSAKGIKWPVGGNIGKWDYLNAALFNGVTLELIPSKVECRELKTTEGKPAIWKDGNLVAVSGNAKADTAATYYFEETEFPATDMSVLPK